MRVESKQPIRLLIVDDCEDDALLLLRLLKKAGMNILHQQVYSAAAMRKALEQHQWDAIICDHNMPEFNSLQALMLLQEQEQDIPFIIVSGEVGEEVAVNAMKAGAHDYIMKENLSRLVPAIERELNQAKHRREHQTAVDTIRHMAFHDPLTGLKNRYEFEKRLERCLHSAIERELTHVLLLLDLDRFKIINDTCGHMAGDKVLVEVSNMLQQCTRERDTIARLGGDEFGIILETCPPERGEVVAKNIHQLLNNYRLVWQEKSFNVGVSIGLVPINQLSNSTESIMSIADLACYTAKDEGRNRTKICLVDDSDIRQRRNEMEWATHVQTALNNDYFMLYRQDIVSLSHPDEKPYCEFLVRLVDDQNVYLPATFMPAAERYDLMPQVDRKVVELAFLYLSKLRPEDNPELAFINLSAATLNDGEFFSYLKSSFEQYRITPSHICFEITETVAISNITKALQFIAQIRGLGCKFALDDFGSGMSSFAYMKQIPVDFLKIDGSFITHIVDSKVDQAIVSAINEIAHVAGFKTIAEFIENKSIYQHVKAIGVDYGQGSGINFGQGYAIHYPEQVGSFYPDKIPTPAQE